MITDYRQPPSLSGSRRYITEEKYAGKSTPLSKEEAEGKARVGDMKTQLTVTDFEEENIYKPKTLDYF